MPTRWRQRPESTAWWAVLREGHRASGGNALCCRPSFCAFSVNARVLSLLPVLLLDVKQFLKQTSQWFIQSSNNTVRGLCWRQVTIPNTSSPLGGRGGRRGIAAYELLLLQTGPRLLSSIYWLPPVSLRLRTMEGRREGRLSGFSCEKQQSILFMVLYMSSSL